MLLLLLGCLTLPEDDPRRALILAMSPLPAPAPDPTNRVADDPRAAALGASLFQDVGLSRDGLTSCATCHQSERAFTDGKKVATAVGVGTRNTPSLLSAPWQTWFFWDGRADSAWSQATGPIRNPIEMNADAAWVRARVEAAWAAPYTEVFGPIGPADEVLANVGKAIAAHERTLRPPEGALDRYVADLRTGTDSAALTEQEERGLLLFVGRAGCFNCHHGPLLTDHSFHALGLPTGAAPDVGRGEGAELVLADPYNCRGAYSDAPDRCDELRYLDPGFEDWPGAFKTPSLRGVGRTAPYMHDGSMPTLEAVVSFYSTLPGRAAVGHRELTLQPLMLSDTQQADLTAFLRTL